jgi:hypothetical protein
MPARDVHAPIYARVVGLLAVDVTSFGVVMSADSQPVEILGGKTLVLPTAGRRSWKHLMVRTGGGFAGLVGYVGTEQIGSTPTYDWLRDFSRVESNASVGVYCDRLATVLTQAWNDHGLLSVLEILVTGVEGREVQFWYVRNSQGLRADGMHEDASMQFTWANDLDQNYIPKDAAAGQSKDDVLRKRMYSFRQGLLMPASTVFDTFAGIMGAIYSQNIIGFSPISSLDDLGHYARQRMEFLKRLYSPTHGIYTEGARAPVGGEVHVYGVSRAGEVRQYVKGRRQVKTVYPAA